MVGTTHTVPAAESAQDGGRSSNPEDKPFHTGRGQGAVHISSEPVLDHTGDDLEVKGESSVRRKITRLLQGKEQEWTTLVTKSPLHLLDLPMDILKEIIKEVTHTNDLAALALTHSALHALAIPHIYSRFDIVWPDVSSNNDSRSGVDALTYGLATLVMGKGNFPSTMNRRIGNDYPQYTRKFSLGNGPADWVQEYMITKESGKMLGTLVALAVARMINLEQFLWDMPTGVLRDVWLSLSSLQAGSPAGNCKLEKVLVRWHDNSVDMSGLAPSTAPSGPPIPAGAQVTSIGILVDSDTLQSPAPIMAGQDSSSQRVHEGNRVECPTFSVLPPLKSLSVLDIDELSYLDEMSVLIEKSKHCLEELRVGISKKAQWKDFVMAWDGPQLQQVDLEHDHLDSGSSKIGERRLGGVLGILLGRVYNIRHKTRVLDAHERQCRDQNGEHHPDIESDGLQVADPKDTDADCQTSKGNPQTAHGDVNSSRRTSVLRSMASAAISVSDLTTTLESVALHPVHDSDIRLSSMQPAKPFQYSKRAKQCREDMLRLHTLELERVPLSVSMLQRGFDWSLLTSLTLLDCSYHEQVWRMLRKQFAPKSPGHGLGALGPSNQPLDYQLNLKKLHTDHVTPALISFLKETLAPNTLEVLFLQDRKRSGGAVTQVNIEHIYKGPLKRHRKSLKKLLIDSSDRIPRAPSASNEHNRWRNWMVTHDVLAFITSGQMSSLRELSIAIDYRDWHFFLRRLPQIHTLRSLNIPWIADHVTSSYDPKELALQIVDMIFLRPEIELCYLGISNKCFEILENRHKADREGGPETVHGHGMSDEDDEDVTDGDEEDEEVEDEDDDDGLESEQAGGFSAVEAVEAEGGVIYAGSELDDSDVESSVHSIDGKEKVHLRLREILYYDDKVAIFRARHMKL